MPIESVCIHIAKWHTVLKHWLNYQITTFDMLYTVYNGLEALRHKDDYHKRTRIVLHKRVGAPATDMRRELNWPTLASRRAVREAVAVYQVSLVVALPICLHYSSKVQEWNPSACHQVRLLQRHPCPSSEDRTWEEGVCLQRSAEVEWTSSEYQS